MSLFTGRKKIIGLALDGQRCAVSLLEPGRGKGVSSVSLLRTMPMDSLEGLGAALGDLSASGGQICAVSVPLSMLDTVNVSLPALPPEALAGAVNYQLAKSLDRGLEHYVSAWQEVARDEKQVKVTVYLMEKACYAQIETAVRESGLELRYLEPGIFSAFSFLDAQERLPAGAACLCCLMMPGQVSMGVCRNGLVALERNIALEIAGEGASGEETPPAGADLSSPGRKKGSKSLLEEFDLQMVDDEIPGPQPGLQINETEESLPDADSVDPVEAYLQDITLEVMRTRDYYVSVMKQTAIKNVFLCGDDTLVDRLRDILSLSMESDTETLVDRKDLPESCPPHLWAMSAGVVLR